MSVRVDEAQGVIRLEGECPIEDADALLRSLLAHADADVDWRDCMGAHTAVVQILLLAKRPVHGPPRDDFLARHVQPALQRPKAVA